MTKDYENLIKQIEEDSGFYHMLNNDKFSLISNINLYLTNLHFEKIVSLAKEWEISPGEMEQFIGAELMTDFWFNFRKFKNLKN